MKKKNLKKRLKLKTKKTAKKKIKKVKSPKKVLIKVKRKIVKKPTKKSVKAKKKITAKKKTTIRAIKKRKAPISIKSKPSNKKKKKQTAKKKKNTIKKKLVFKNKKTKGRKKPILKKAKIVIKKSNKIQNPQKTKVKQIIKPAKNEIIKKENLLNLPDGTLFKAKIKVVGIGGGGGSIVSEIGRSLNKATFVIADTDIRALKKKTGIKTFSFGEKFTHGLGTGVNPEMAKEAAEFEKEKIAELFRDQDIVILIASLGGGLGSGATQVFAEAAKSFGGITLGIFTLPFKFEGKNKLKIAQKAIKELKNSLNVSITIPNEKIFKIINNDTSITEAFSTVNKNLIESLESLIDLIYNPGLINIDFADLRTILNGSGDFAFLNTVQVSGKDRVQETIEKIFTNPLYQNNNFTAERILFNISGGNNLSMFEVEKISRFISEFNPKAKIIFGISRNIKSKNKIKTTILMTGPSKTAGPEKKIIKKVKVDKKEQKVKKAKIIQKSPKNELSGSSVIPILNREQIAKEPVSKLSIVEVSSVKVKKTIRRNALEIKKAEAAEQDKRLLQEEEWEVPAFLRRVKFKS